MQLEKTAHWLTIIGNFGLLVGVALVILQINQNSDLTREQLEHAMWSDRLQVQLAMMVENPAAAVAKSVEDPSSLSLEESKIVDAYLLYWALYESRNILQERRGMRVESFTKNYSSSDPDHDLDLSILGNAYAKARYEAVGFGPDLTPRVEGLMNSLSGDETISQYRALRREIADMGESGK